MAERRGGYITPEMCVYMTIRWLAGASYIDVINGLDISKPHFFRLLWLTIDAIIYSTDPHLDNIHFPTTEEKCHEASQGFQAISYHYAIPNCVSVVDGYNIKIETPSEEVGNVRSYFSGHYQRYSMNVQAAVDSKCRFQFIGVAGPGVMSDRDAVAVCGLLELINRVPAPFMCIGDAGYTAYEAFATIFNAWHARDKKKDNFNYFTSQLRIRVEMAFGLLVHKWGVLQKPLAVDTFRVWKVVLAVGRLHNFCINQREYSLNELNFTEARELITPSQPQRDCGTPILEPDDRAFEPGYSSRAAYVVNDIARRGLSRPQRS